MSRKRRAKPINIRLNYQDDQLQSETAAILQELPEESPARIAFAADKMAVEIMRLLPPDRGDLLERLKAAHFAWICRTHPGRY